jgi:transposase
MRPHGPAALLEERRRRALKLLDQRLSLQEVARRIGCAASSVLRWRNARRKGGTNALQVRFSPGRPPKLSRQDRGRLVKLLLRGALAHGYRTDLWTTPRIAALIRKHFGVHYHPDHIGRLMHQLDWSYQKPERRARERDDVAIERWKRERWSRVKKTPGGWRPISSLPTSRASS